MATVDINSLLAEVAPGAPCGDDLSQGELRELERAAQGKLGGMVGETADVGPDWRAVCERATALFSRTKDLRLSVLLAQSLLHTEGLSGFGAGLECVRGLVERYWSDVHPRLDPEDNHDPTQRIFVLKELSDREGMLGQIRRASLVSDRQLGSFGLRDIMLASGELKLPKDTSELLPTQDVIATAFANCDLAQLRATASTIYASLEHLQEIEARVTGKAGPASPLRLPKLVELLQRMGKILDMQIAARSAKPAAGVTNGHGEEQPGSVRDEQTIASAQVRSREDVIHLLDKICEYYRRYEPSSPVPVLLTRCKRLVPMQFKDIVQDLVPAGFSQFEVFQGPDETGQ